MPCPFLLQAPLHGTNQGIGGGATFWWEYMSLSQTRVLEPRAASYTGWRNNAFLGLLVWLLAVAWLFLHLGHYLSCCYQIFSTTRLLWPGVGFAVLGGGIMDKRSKCWLACGRELHGRCPSGVWPTECLRFYVDVYLLLVHVIFSDQ